MQVAQWDFQNKATSTSPPWPAFVLEVPLACEASHARPECGEALCTATLATQAKVPLYNLRPSLRSKRLCGVREREKLSELKREEGEGKDHPHHHLSFFWLSPHFPRGPNTENPVPRSFFAPKPHGNACYAGYLRPSMFEFVTCDQIVQRAYCQSRWRNNNNRGLRRWCFSHHPGGFLLSRDRSVNHH